MSMTASAIMHRTVEANGIHLHVAEQGEGPVVVLCYGFPGCWYSWRYQLAALSAAGFRAVAPDMRGYGQSDRRPGRLHPCRAHLQAHVMG
jgi:pimeloyl-ACP methyl ester carboxylesterase